MWVLYEEYGRPFKAFKSKEDALDWIAKNKLIREPNMETFWVDESKKRYGLVYLQIR